MKKGFTIVETLVAITILMIAIAGPLTVANQAFHAAQDARNQLIATNLVQETVEEVRNYKDNHINGTTLGTLFSGYLDPNAKYAVQAGPNGSSYTLESCLQAGNSSCALYLSPNIGYTYDPGASNLATPFTRWFSLSPVGDAASATEFLLTVTVAWSTGSLANQIQVEDLLSANTR